MGRIPVTTQWLEIGFLNGHGPSGRRAHSLCVVRSNLILKAIPGRRNRLA